MLPAARALAAVAPGDREVFPWTPVLLALHTSMQGQDAHWLTIAVLTGSAFLMLLTRRGTSVRKLSALLLGGAAALVMFELQYAFSPCCPASAVPEHDCARAAQFRRAIPGGSLRYVTPELQGSAGARGWRRSAPH